MLLLLGAISSHTPYRSPSCAAIRVVLPLSPTMATQQYPWMLHSDRGMLTVLLPLQCSQSLLQIWQQGKKMPGINSSADLAQLILCQATFNHSGRYPATAATKGRYRKIYACSVVMLTQPGRKKNRPEVHCYFRASRQALAILASASNSSSTSCSSSVKIS